MAGEVLVSGTWHRERSVQAIHVRHGEALHPDREPIETLDRIRRTLGQYNFAGQHRQSPAPLGGSLFKAERFRHYRQTELPNNSIASELISQRASMTTKPIQPRSSWTGSRRPCRAGGYEHKALGAQLVRPAGDKIMRLHAQTAMIENGLCTLVPPHDLPGWRRSCIMHSGRDERAGHALHLPSMKLSSLPSGRC
jgi:hypothetical protein